ncbi:MAG: lariat debranching enzyme, C-terminal domain-containing protein [Piptocephalis tieghemiana]|nr:MAG: lariat debranching enzyme, C-terminal domain-containing protein [Piptocephalis tieghemiana]
MRIAVEGCCHGELNAIYGALGRRQEVDKVKVDLLIICGDFQGLRNEADMETLACPAKYRRLGDFADYYAGRKKPLCPTIFIGGNHESSGALWELFHGGWVCPDIYYLGAAGVVRFGDLRIGGLSGIFKGHDYERGHWERPPFRGGGGAKHASGLHSVYHIRQREVFQLAQIQEPLDVMLTHDWPQGIAYHGDVERLLRAKPFLRSDLQSGRLGSPPAKFLLDRLTPRHWFSAHLHTRFTARVMHSPLGEASKGVGNPDEVVIDADDSEDEEKGGAGEEEERGPGRPPYTDFLSLDKCLPRRSFLEILDFPDKSAEKGFRYDREWLSILRATQNLLALGDRQEPALPADTEIRGVIQEARTWVDEHISTDELSIPHDFTPTAPVHHPSQRRMTWEEKRAQGLPHVNPQTKRLCQMLGMEDRISKAIEEVRSRHSKPSSPAPPVEETRHASPSRPQKDLAGQEEAPMIKRPRMNFPPPKATQQSKEDGEGALDQ